jgi:thioredoxin reductase (NADPH)
VVVVEDVAIGGQAGSSSRIENYLGFYRGVSGVELARAAMLQSVKFGTRLVSPRSVTGLAQGPGGFRVRLDDEHDVVAGVQITLIRLVPPHASTCRSFARSCLTSTAVEALPSPW